MNESRLDERIRELMQRVAQHAPEPPPLPELGCTPARARFGRRWVAVLALTAVAAIIVTVVAVVLTWSPSGREHVTVSPSPPTGRTTTMVPPAPATFSVPADQVASVLVARGVPGVDPVLVPSAAPSSWSATVDIVENSFSVEYRSSAGADLTLAVTIPNPPNVAPPGTGRLLTFRGDPSADFRDMSVHDPGSQKMLLWWEPGRWADPMYTNTPHAKTVPYFLTSTGIDTAQFWAIANSLQKVPLGPISDNDRRVAQLQPVIAAQLAAQQAAYSLAVYKAAHPELRTVSSPQQSAAGVVAVAGVERSATERTINVLTFAHNAWAITATLQLPFPNFDVRTDPVQVADVTGDGQPDFLVMFDATAPVGVVVSHDGGTWTIIGLDPHDPRNVYIYRTPVFTNGHLESTVRDCVPDCARGTVHTATYSYDRATRTFTMTTSG
jgi:hypothetical protein